MCKWILFVVAFTSLTILITTPVSGEETRHIEYITAVSSDEGLFQFFSEVLKSEGSCLEKFIDEDEMAYNCSLSTKKTVELVKEESIIYSEFKGNVSIVLPPFLHLSSAVERLTLSQKNFLKNFNDLKRNRDYDPYLNAKRSLTEMKVAAAKIDESISEIEDIELWNASERLYFDVEGVRENLKDVYELIGFYEALLSKYKVDGLIVVVSNQKPFIKEKVKIYIFAVNVTPEALFIDDRKLPPKNTEIAFNKIGEHIIYAEGYKNGKTIRSNIVTISVRKIPTMIILSSKSSAYIGNRVDVDGVLLDYFGNRIDGEVYVNMGKKELRYKGAFSFNVTRETEGFINITAGYTGNETYSATKTNLSIFFSRFPVSIYIEAEKEVVKVNEILNFTGRIQGVNVSVPLSVYVNSSQVGKIEALTTFSFALNFTEEGEYRVYVKFPGNSIYRPASSNEVLVKVEGFAAYPLGSSGTDFFLNLILRPLYLSMIILSFLLLSILIFRKLKKKEKKKPEMKRPEIKESEIQLEKPDKIAANDIKTGQEIILPESIDGAYRTIFDKLVEKYGLKKSLTPREILRKLKDEPFGKMLEKITEIHEKSVYGKIQISDQEKNYYLKLIRKVLEGLI